MEKDCKRKNNFTEDGDRAVRARRRRGVLGIRNAGECHEAEWLNLSYLPTFLTFK